MLVKVKSTDEVIMNKVLWSILNDKNELNNLIKELTAIKRQLNGIVNQQGHALSDALFKKEDVIAVKEKHDFPFITKLISLFKFIFKKL